MSNRDWPTIGETALTSSQYRTAKGASNWVGTGMKHSRDFGMRNWTAGS